MSEIEFIITYSLLNEARYRYAQHLAFLYPTTQSKNYDVLDYTKVSVDILKKSITIGRPKRTALVGIEKLNNVPYPNNPAPTITPSFGMGKL